MNIQSSWARRGFTLIELLVVLTIIGLLAGVVSLNTLAARRQSRDSRRKADVQSIAGALEIYRASNRQYPASLSVLVPEYTSNVPNDPLGKPYVYHTNDINRPTKFALTATLETDTEPVSTGIECADVADPDYFRSGICELGNQRYYRASGP